MLLSIQALLSAPNPDDPLANDVAEKWKDDEAQAIETGTSIHSSFHKKNFISTQICKNTSLKFDGKLRTS